MGCLAAVWALGLLALAGYVIYWAWDKGPLAWGAAIVAAVVLLGLSSAFKEIDKGDKK